MLKEIIDLFRLGPFSVVSRSELLCGRRRPRRPLKSKFVYKVKQNDDGFMTRRKSRFVACGYSQLEGIDFHQVRSAVVEYSNARAIIALAAAQAGDLISLDISNAFVTADIDENEVVYLEPPPHTLLSGQSGTTS